MSRIAICIAYNVTVTHMATASTVCMNYRTLLSSELGDEEGELTVGGQATSNSFTGTLQDVRIYLGILQLR
jgi:hypothetical protein